MLEIGQGEFTFCAAHAGMHEDGFEPLHGHTYQVTLRLAGPCDLATGTVLDIGTVKAALREVIRPLQRRTLVAAKSPFASVEMRDRQVFVSDGNRSWSFPIDDVVLLPLVNTSTEELTGYLLDQLAPMLPPAGLRWIEMAVTEAPGVSVMVRMDLR